MSKRVTIQVGPVSHRDSPAGMTAALRDTRCTSSPAAPAVDHTPEELRKVSLNFVKKIYNDGS